MIVWDLLRELFGARYTQFNRPRRVPWPEDMHVDLNAYINKEGEHVVYVSAAADGPNPDGTFHHASIGYWTDFDSVEDAEEFCQRVADDLEEIHGIRPVILCTLEEQNEFYSRFI